jgi:hypothetical protein
VEAAAKGRAPCPDHFPSSRARAAQCSGPTQRAPTEPCSGHALVFGSQIWIAVSAYVLVAIVKKRLQLSASLYEILQILSLTMFEKILLDQLLTQTISEQIQPVSDNQLILFA